MLNMLFVIFVETPKTPTHGRTDKYSLKIVYLSLFTWKIENKEGRI